MFISRLARHGEQVHLASLFRSITSDVARMLSAFLYRELGTHYRSVFENPNHFLYVVAV